jgi:predicted nucleic acid-binding protein
VPSKQVRIALDSSYLIALLCEWHGRHRRTLQSYQQCRARDAQVVVPVHALLECYSVLTRLPAPYRLPPDIARQIIERNFGRSAALVGLKSGGIWERIANLAHLGFGGGQVYDALIAWCAEDAGAIVLLTWNLRHFVGIAPSDLEVREP